jgi:hypothetical protein
MNKVQKLGNSECHAPRATVSTDHTFVDLAAIFGSEIHGLVSKCTRHNLIFAILRPFQSLTFS